MKIDRITKNYNPHKCLQIDKESYYEKMYHGDKNDALDPFGYSININDFDVDHIYPQYLGGEDVLINMIPMSWEANRIKGSQVNGNISQHNFKVKKRKIVHYNIEFTFGVLYVDDNEVSWTMSDFSDRNDIKDLIYSDLENKLV